MRNMVFVIIFGLFFSCSDKKSASENLNDAIEKVNNKEFDSAYELIKSAYNKDTSNSNILYYKGIIETNLKKNSDALISFQKAILLDTTNYKVLVERAKLKIVLGDLVSALADCDKSRLIKKDYSEIYLTKAHAYERMNDNSNAIIQYETAIQFGAKTGEIYFKVGLLNLNAGKQDIACNFLRMAGDLGFMESFELIKTNCNSESNIKSDKNIESTSKLSSKTKIVSAPNIKIGDSFKNWKNEFTIKGISSNTGLHSYLYNKKITAQICDHEVDKFIVNTKNNKVVTYIFLLIPNSEDIGVPGCLIKKIQKENGVQLVYKNGAYGASDGNIIISLLRKNDKTFGGDRIWIYTTTND